tara:strand:+ start:176 stop:1123 length:948 start_codon:yes stop_codon:yes gene_type:complete
MRNYNIDRERISSDEITSFKDFKSILKKHAQTTQDLARIKPSGLGGKMYWIIGGVISTVVISSLLILGGDSPEVNSPEVVANTVVENQDVVETPSIQWQTIIRTSKNPIEEEINVNSISANRVDFVRFGNSSEVSSLLQNVQSSDADFVAKSLIFKFDNEETLEISNDNDLYKLSDDGRWNKVAYTPMEIAYIEKPVLWKKGELAIKMNFQNFDGQASNYKNIFWKPVNLMDLDESFFSTDWEDASVNKTSVKGVYNLVFKLGEIEKSFNGYPALPKKDYNQAVKVYNRKLLKAQEDLKSAPKVYEVSGGVYTIK